MKQLTQKQLETIVKVTKMIAEDFGTKAALETALNLAPESRHLLIEMQNEKLLSAFREAAVEMQQSRPKITELMPQFLH